ncbi:MAG: hypothetical protein KKB70_08510 [Proteobacteria bacterium]|nr:hypothetical protein [Pseudomonadota bacterium]
MYRRTYSMASLSVAFFFGFGYQYQAIAERIPELWGAGPRLVAAACWFLNVSALFTGTMMPNRLHRFLYPYEDTNRCDEAREMWQRCNRHWTHAWILSIPACLISYFVWGPNMVFMFLVGYSTHCILDAFTITGAPILVPWKRVSIIPLQEGTYQDRRFMAVIWLLFIASGFNRWWGVAADWLGVT